jgi:hypothetical protein
MYAHEQEYYGLKLFYENTNYKIYADFIGNLGNRKYYVYDLRTNQHKQKVNGFASEIELSINFDKSEFSFINLFARGDKQIADPNKLGLNFKRDLGGFYEIVPGSYQGNQFYFNGSNSVLNSGTGLGHSINNTNMQGIRLKYNLSDSEIKYKAALYQIKRVESVIDNDGEFVKDIGLEFDNVFSLIIANHAVLEVDMNFFLPKEAFSLNDHTPPGQITDLFLLLATRFILYFLINLDKKRYNELISRKQWKQNLTLNFIFDGKG